VNNYRQLISKAELSPREYTSGSSIRGKMRITKMGGSLVRSKLFMCSFSKISNAVCEAFYEQLVVKGKNEETCFNRRLQQAAQTSFCNR